MASLLVGCAGKKTSKFISVEGRFGYVGHVRGFTDRSLTTSFCYQDPNGNVIGVWPYLQMVWGNNMVISNDTAVFIGGVAMLFKDGRERLDDRLMAFRGPAGPPLDITEQVFQKYYAGTGLGMTNFCGFNTIIKTNGSIWILFGSSRIRPGSKNIWDPFDCEMTVAWNEISAIMQDVKENGKFKKEKWSGFEYLQKD